MDLTAIGKELVAGCREGREAENLEKLYAVDAVSVEAVQMPGSDSRETVGLKGIRGKHAWWEANMEVTEQVVSGPFPHGDDRFAVHFKVKGRDKSSGDGFDMEEVAVYHVAGGRIVREEFFYQAG
ncbi:nuclear transport factor 2 family protein [Roseivivax sediminis]|uniref:SnoaL-like domain-containing protein n=1 Tax=Roseivivax sediminis TaxID=936889 RepID=A0A1I1YRA6_9RHOB|nr:nuclear transport factor 2 family protein [Roseivivax sediminis]SFE21852.1 SnoaL-like domain-containing protein [Roseivivax sediminis]